MLFRSENVGRRARRTRPSAQTSTLVVDTAPSFGKGDPAGLARDMLAQLQSDGFAAPAQSSKSNPFPSRRNRRRPVGLEVTTESPNETDSVTPNDSIALGDHPSVGCSRTNSPEVGGDDSTGDITIRVDSSS